MQTSDVVTHFVESQPVEMMRIIERLRKVVTSSMPGTQEMVYHGALGYSPTQSPFDRIVYIMPYENRVTLGFFFGAHLPDPEHLLEGEGKRMRHVKIRSIEQADGIGIKKLLKEAQEDAPASLATIHEKMHRRDRHSK